MTIDQTKSRQQTAFDQMRADILNGVLRPGERLRFNEICNRYDVSVGVSREALSRLVEQGLVTMTHQAGYAVMSLSAHDLQDLTVARCGIESMAIRYAVNRHDVAWESQVLAAHHRLTSCEFDESSDEWANVHREFHETLLSGSGSEHLNAVATQLRDSAEVYRRWSLAFSNPGDRDIDGEHKAIVDAVLASNADLAASLLADHVGRTATVLLNSPDIDWTISS